MDPDQPDSAVPAGWQRHQIDDDTLVLVRDGANRRIVTVGAPENETTLVFNAPLASRRYGRFERALSGFVGAHHAKWLLKELRADVVFDVGANLGQFAERLRHEGYEGRIVSFEPLPEFVEQLREKAADDPDWKVFGCALGNEDGTAEIHLTPGRLSSMLPASEFGKGWADTLQETSTQEIRIRRLADVWDEALEGLTDPRPFLKMDTQGYDVECFRGAGARVEELVGLQSEVAMVPIYDGMPRLIEQLATYEDAGFETTGIYTVNRDRSTTRLIEMDLMMIGPKALAERSG